MIETEIEIVLAPLPDPDEMMSLMMNEPPDTLLRRRRMAIGRGSMPRRAKARPRMTRRRKIKVFNIKYFFIFRLSQRH